MKKKKRIRRGREEILQKTEQENKEMDKRQNWRLKPGYMIQKRNSKSKSENMFGRKLLIKQCKEHFLEIKGMNL